ncbi:nickel pincer cofactor biosynthesis protein LarB [Streptosporangium sp. KLBMP 9127]|nr:nickel pincer cofactor biosynthesis protein LarB [Streptosporangium sp. KLBMP 9127]
MTSHPADHPPTSSEPAVSHPSASGTAVSETAESLDLGFARVDLDREARQGLPEVVYGPGKTADEIIAIVSALLARNTGAVLVTRVGPATADAVLAAVPGFQGAGSYDAVARLLVWRPAAPRGFAVTVVTAGTSDGPVASEAAAVAKAIGLTVDVVRDVGVAGLHRLLAEAERLRAADAVIVVAGMEGALASAVGGLVRGPVIAVPTSTGYGAAFEGVTALLAMLSSCAAGVTVVNIDSGFAAAMAAHRLAQPATRRRLRTASAPDPVETADTVTAAIPRDPTTTTATSDRQPHDGRRLPASEPADNGHIGNEPANRRPADGGHVGNGQAESGQAESGQGMS